MLGSGSSSRHEFGSGSRIHRGERVLVQMMLDESALGRGALRLESIARATGRHIDHVAFAPMQSLRWAHRLSQNRPHAG